MQQGALLTRLEEARRDLQAGPAQATHHQRSLTDLRDLGGQSLGGVCVRMGVWRWGG